jgi:hypothetical protein
MLRAAVLGLARDREVTVVARGRGDLEALRKSHPSIHPAPADYRDAAAFAAILDGAVAARGPFSLGVAWIHSDAPDAALAAAARVRGPFLHVLGSAAADPALPDPGRRARFEALPGVAYREVILGFVLEGGPQGPVGLPLGSPTLGRARWLTDAEISRGVLDAVAADRPRSVVGVVEPWSAKP